MNFEELSNIWKDSDESLEKNLTVNKTLFKEVSMMKIKSSLKETMLETYIEIACYVPFIGFLIDFLGGHLGIVRFAVPALFLLLVSYVSLVFCGFKMWIYYSINAKASVLTTQKNLARLQYYNRLDTNLLYILIPLFAVAFMIVVIKAAIGLDLYIFSSMLIQFALGSFVVGVIIVFFLKRFPDKELKKANAFLKEIREME